MGVTDEFEAKFELPDGVALPDLAGLGAIAVAVERPAATLDARYYDTDDLALLAQGVTLRWREDDSGVEPAIWTLKVPFSRAGSGWGRTELTWSGPPEAVPGELRRLITGVIRGRTVGCVARLRTRRRRIDLLDGSGARLAEVADDDVALEGTALEGGSSGGRFRQIEVELDGGDAALAGRIGRALKAAGGRRGPDEPKLATALGRRPARLRPPAPKRSATVADVVAWALRRTLAELEVHDLALRLGDDPEVVHRARVATRRARADLGTLQPLLDPVWVRDTRADLRWLGALLGEVRDADVLASRLARHGEDAAATDRDGFAALAARLERSRSVAAAAMRAGLGEPRYVELLQRLDGAAASPPWRVDRLGGWAVKPTARAGPTLRRLARRPWRHLLELVRSLPATPSAEELHEVRKATKQLRYAAELCRPVAGRDASRLARAAVALQDRLGAHQDGAAAESWLRAVIADQRHPAGSGEAFAAGQLVASERRAQSGELEVWPDDWARVRKQARTGWPG